MAKITITINPPVKDVIVKFGTATTEPIPYTTTNEFGEAIFDWPSVPFVRPYISLQKIDYVFSDSLSVPKVPNCFYPYPQCVNWGGSSKWFKISPWSNTKRIYAFKKPPELPPVPELPLVEEVIEEVEEVIEKIIEEVCRTEADPTVPAALSAYFPISIRNARWICDGIPENITGTGIIRIKGSDVAQIPIRNGYGSPINIGTTPVFRDLLKELVG